jgi:hypothetical protein
MVKLLLNKASKSESDSDECIQCKIGVGALASLLDTDAKCIF